MTAGKKAKILSTIAKDDSKSAFSCSDLDAHQVENNWFIMKLLLRYIIG
jgi:hypothetical protein